MIVRISLEGQYDVADAASVQLGELDNEAVAACDAGDAVRFHDVFGAMLALVRAGTPVADDALHPSEIILPPPDVSLQEARAEFHGEGLIPG